jgi:O-succinylbenzoic acid--CoA ligase
MLDALAAAIDGTGPAIAPLDPAMPRARLNDMLAALAPDSIRTDDDIEGVVPAAGGAAPSPGVADDIAVVLATSGSTGAPKAAELSARALLASSRASLSRLGAGRGDRWVCCLPTHHISGLAVLVRSLVTGQAPLACLQADPVAVARAAAAGCGYISLVPTQLRRLLDAGAGPALASFRAILVGGAAIPAGLLEAAAMAGARVVTSYGMTETCGGCVYDGLPLDGVRVASGEDGRISIAGPVLFSRYRLAPALTRAVLHDGWFGTCDLGGLGADGKLTVRGRADDVINSGGEKVVAAEVEQALRDCPGVGDVAVVGVPDPEWGERVTALVVAVDPADPPSLGRLREHVRDKLPGYAAPRAVKVVAEIPALGPGKPDKPSLRRLAV